MPKAPKDETVDEKKMEGLLKKMLSTPPKPHKKGSADGKGSTVRPPSSVEGTGNQDNRPRPKR